MDSVFSRYALALFSIAKEENKIDEYLNEITSIHALLAENPQIITILKDYGLSSQEKSETIDLLFKDKIPVNIYNFINVIVENSRAKYLLDIFKEYEKQTYLFLNIKIGYIYSTYKLSDSEIEAISNKVSKIINSKVNLTNKIDKNLIGGFKVDIDGQIIDMSITNRLYSLKEEISKKKKEA